MINKKIVIAALARDCKDALEQNIPRIERLRNFFTGSNVVVIENDSKDGTKLVLSEWASNSANVHIISRDYGTITIHNPSIDDPHPSTGFNRIAKMATYRNMYMDYIRENNLNPDYLIVIDIDVESFSVSGVVDAIQNAPADWGGLFANGQRFFHGMFPFYFDLFAYLPFGCEDKISRKMDEHYYESRRITKRLKTKCFVDCLSAFGGLGIYKWVIIKDQRYRALENDRSRINKSICEHITFNLAVINKGLHNYVCQGMKLNYGQRSLKEVIVYSLPISIFKLIYLVTKGKSFED